MLYIGNNSGQDFGGLVNKRKYARTFSGYQIGVYNWTMQISEHTSNCTFARGNTTRNCNQKHLNSNTNKLRDFRFQRFPTLLFTFVVFTGVKRSAWLAVLKINIKRTVVLVVLKYDLSHSQFNLNGLPLDESSTERCSVTIFHFFHNRISVFCYL